MVARNLIESLSALSIVQRLEVLDWLNANLDTGEISQSHRELLDRRLDSFEADPGAGSSWAEVEARLRSNLSRR